MGLPVKALIEQMAKTVPVLTPISLTLDICAIIAGVNPIAPPLLKPKSKAKTIIGAFEYDGIHNPRMMMTVKKAITIITLKRPILSPMKPGNVRPKIEPALRMLTRY